MDNEIDTSEWMAMPPTRRLVEFLGSERTKATTGMIRAGMDGDVAQSAAYAATLRFIHTLEAGINNKGIF